MKFLIPLFTVLAITSLAGPAYAEDGAQAAIQAASAKNDPCIVEVEDPQFHNFVKASCCRGHGGTVDPNSEGNPPLRICLGGKYDGYYVH